jgi:transcriptional regulator with PAS, ATPase and Fis domain
MNNKLKVLIIEQHGQNVSEVLQHLTFQYFTVDSVVVNTAIQFHEQLSMKPDLIISYEKIDWLLPVVSLALEQILCKSIPFIIVADEKSECNISFHIKNGASDVVISRQMELLPYAVYRALEINKIQHALSVAEKKILWTHSGYQNVIDNAADPMCAVDTSYNLITYNKAYADIIGYKGGTGYTC